MATVVLGDFEWDERKAAANLRKHGVSFEEALTALADPTALTAPDLVDAETERLPSGLPRSRVYFSLSTPNAFDLDESGSSAPARPRQPKGKSMKKDDLPATKLPEGHLGRYDWSRAIRGKYAAKAAKASALLRILDPELARRFPDSRTVNTALRSLVALEGALPRRRGGRSHAA